MIGFTTVVNSIVVTKQSKEKKGIININHLFDVKRNLTDAANTVGILKQHDKKNNKLCEKFKHILVLITN